MCVRKVDTASEARRVRNAFCGIRSSENIAFLCDIICIVREASSINGWRIEIGFGCWFRIEIEFATIDLNKKSNKLNDILTSLI